MAGAMPGTELVGRDEELARVEGFLEGVEESPAALVLEGDPGIGKTTLWRAVLDGVSARDFLILRAQPTKVERRLSFAALADLLAPVTDELGGLPLPQRKALRAALLIDEPTGPGLSERAAATALLSLLALLAAAQTVLLAVDDVPFELDAERVTVAPLSPASIDHILRERFALRLTRPMLKKLHADSGGNPLYALELGRALAEGATPRALDEPMPAPADLATLLSRRLARLSRPARQALRAASLLADPTIDRIEATAGAGGIDEAVAAGVAMVERGRVRFDHPLLASVIFDEMDAGERRRIHARLADVVDGTEERARHRAAATEAPDTETAALLDDAARRAAGRGAAAAAEDLAAHAVRMTPAADDTLRHRRLLEAGKLARAAGDLDRCKAFLREAVDAAPSGGRRAEALLWLAGNGTDDRAEARRLLDEALRHADGDAVLSALILANAANSSVVETPSERLDLARRSLVLAEQSGDERVLGRALATVGSMSFYAGLGPQRDVLQRAIAIEDRSGAPEVDDNPIARYHLAYQLATTGAADEARPLYEELIARTRDLDRETVSTFLEALGRVELRAGNWERTQDLVEEARQTAIESGRDGYAAQYLYALSMVAAYRGDETRARRLVDEMAEGGVRFNLPVTRVAAGAVLGFLELSLGNLPAAVEQFSLAAEAAAERGLTDPSQHFFLPDLAEALVLSGRIDEADAALRPFEEKAEELDRAVQLAPAKRARAAIAEAEGEPTAAGELLDAALELHERFVDPFERARTLLVRGSLRRRQRRRREGRSDVETALGMFDELGAPLWAARARDELSQIAGRAPSPNALTPAEERIAVLVAAGKSNAEVANALFLSPKTVEWNLSKVYKKLHVASRTELAAKLAKR